jgi:fructoselysine-6-P-deglycase FrlB-like protein
MTAESLYRAEIDSLPAVIDAAEKGDIGDLRRSIEAASTAGILGVGSGGSFSAATFLCHLHEIFTGRLSRPATPLEIICNPTLAAESPVFIISSEGKNPDVVEALTRARNWSARAVHVISNRSESPLTVEARSHTDVRVHVFPLPEKDGYLATRSLVLNATQIARSYLQLDGANSDIPSALRSVAMEDSPARAWLKDERLVDEVASRQGVILVHSPLLRPIAIDLESKLSESTLLHCQLADLRSFAHGRHLWLESRSADTSIVALIEPTLQPLWQKTRELLPQDFPVLTLALPNADPWNLIVGLVAQMYFVDAVARRSKVDPARPKIGSFAKELHYMPLSNVVPNTGGQSDFGETSKRSAMGWQWPAKPQSGAMGRALKAFLSDLNDHRFRAVVFDYDGTLCAASQRTEPLGEPIVRHLVRLAEHGVVVGIASGRGDSVIERLKSAIPQSLRPQFFVGLYNGGYAGTLDELPEEPPRLPYDEFLGHVTRILHRLRDVGVPIETIRTTHPYQVSVRFKEGVSTEHMWFVISDFLRQAGIDLSRVVRSGHSIDVLAYGVSKSRLIAGVIEKFRIGPYELLTVGDKGAWPGNDFDILEHRFSLSVDTPSRRLDRGWNIAPKYKRFVDATLWYMERISLEEGGRFRIAVIDLLPGSDILR